jgi:hypothetical protein
MQAALKQPLRARVRPFRFKKIFACKRNEAKLDPFRMCFACSLQKFRSMFSLLFASFRFKFFASLQLCYFRFEAKRSRKRFFASKETKTDHFRLEFFIFASQFSFRIKMSPIFSLQKKT